MKPKILCAECQTELELGVVKCPGCGTEVEWDTAGPDFESGSTGRACPSCGTDNPMDAEFCSSCGARLQGSKGKSKRGSRQPLRSEGSRDSKKGEVTSPLFSPKLIFAFVGILAIIVIGVELFSDKGQAPAPSAGTMQQMQMPVANMEAGAQIAELEKQIAANPSDTQAMLKLANVAHDGRFFDKAIATYKRYLEKQPKDVNARVDLGICYFETDKLDDAEREMKAALKYDPKHLQAHYNLGIVTLKARKIQESNEWFRKTIAIAPPNSEMGQNAKQFLEQHSSSLIQNK